MGARVGLVLGAGGIAGGAFHAGALAAVAEATGWDPRRAAVVVGTSAGSITGASLRAGLPAHDLLARAQGRPLSPEGARVLGRTHLAPDLRTARSTRQPRPRTDVFATLGRAARQPWAARPTALVAALLPEGTVSTDVIGEGIGGLFPDTWPADPLWLCAVRQTDGRRVVFGRTDPRPTVAQAVAASCAIPGFFAPVVIDGEAYLDGGVHAPTNADVLRDQPLDLVIVSSPMSRRGRRPRLSPDQPMRAWARALVDAEARRLRRQGIAVFTLQPDDTVLTAMGLNAMDPARRAAIASAAFEATARYIEHSPAATKLAALAS